MNKIQQSKFEYIFGFLMYGRHYNGFSRRNKNPVASVLGEFTGEKNIRHVTEDRK